MTKTITLTQMEAAHIIQILKDDARWQLHWGKFAGESPVRKYRLELSEKVCLKLESA